MQDSSPLISIRGIKKVFGHFSALKDISFEVYAGEFVCMLGPNGAGKSTLFKIICGLMQQSGGEVILSGEDIRRNRSRAAAKIGVISHSNYLYDELTAFENLLFFAKLFEVPNPVAISEQLLDEAGLTLSRNQLVRSFSRGMSQRLSIARSLVHDPQILLLDEPFTGLDISSRDVFSRTLRELNYKGRTVLMATHDISEARSLASRAIIIYCGSVVMQEKLSNLSEERVREVYQCASAG